MDLLVAAFVFAVLWYTRYRYDSLGAATDLKLFISLWLGIPRQEPHFSPNIWRWRSHFLLKGYCCLRCACCVSLFFSNFYVLRQIRRKYQENRIEIEELEAKVKRLQWDLDNNRFISQHDFSPLKPILFPCRTSHTRIFPKNHSFSYSYLFVAIPVGWRGWISSLLTADLKSLPWRGRKPKIGWFNVDSADYLARGDSMHGLRGKLDTYLESQNEKVEDYPYAYLITAPRFLGYSFNPVSFWYLYNERKELKAMILEVNNTFDERRMYFLKNAVSEKGISEDRKGNAVAERGNQNGSQAQKSPVENVSGRFTNSWPKDFHVSPFNSRKGAYSLSATDPFFPHLSSGAGTALVNNTITLKSSKQHPKLIARVFSSSDSIDPYKLKGWGTFRFIAAWWWVGFVTFPRIVREAGKLFFRRKLHVWYRPEVLKDSIGRNETEDEKAIAAIFRQYLQIMVENSDLLFSLQFQPGVATMAAQETFVPQALRDKPETQQDTVIFKITSPLFYSQIARCSSVSEYIKTALLKPDPTASTFHTSHPDLLTNIFHESVSASISPKVRTRHKASFVDRHTVVSKKPHSPPTSQQKSSALAPICATADNSLVPTSLLTRLCWLPIHLLRHLSSPSHPSSLSDLDASAMYLTRANAPKVRAYRKAVLKLLLSDYVAFGIPGVIDAALWIVRVWLCWRSVLSFDGLVALYNGQLSVYEAGKVVTGCLSVHLWWGLGEVI